MNILREQHAMYYLMEFSKICDLSFQLLYVFTFKCPLVGVSAKKGRAYGHSSYDNICGTTKLILTVISTKSLTAQACHCAFLLAIHHRTTFYATTFILTRTESCEK